MAQSELVLAIQNFAKDLAVKAESFVRDVATLEVRTFTTPQDGMTLLADQELNLENPDIKMKVQLRAYTRVDFDCDTSVCVPIDTNDQVDRSVWDIHHSMVNQALGNREAMLRSMGDALTSALRALQQAGD